MCAVWFRDFCIESNVSPIARDGSLAPPELCREPASLYDVENISQYFICQSKRPHESQTSKSPCSRCHSIFPTLNGLQISSRSRAFSATDTVLQTVMKCGTYDCVSQPLTYPYTTEPCSSYHQLWNCLAAIIHLILFGVWCTMDPLTPVSLPTKSLHAIFRVVFSLVMEVHFLKRANQIHHVLQHHILPPRIVHQIHGFCWRQSVDDFVVIYQLHVLVISQQATSSLSIRTRCSIRWHPFYWKWRRFSALRRAFMSEPGYFRVHSSSVQKTHLIIVGRHLEKRVDLILTELGDWWCQKSRHLTLNLSEKCSGSIESTTRISIPLHFRLSGFL